MDTQNHPNKIIDDIVVTMDYTLTVDGEVVDSTEGEEPLQFLQGHQNIISGLEKALAGMKVGDKKQVVVNSADAYGDIDPENIIEIPRDEFPAEIPLETGVELEVKNEEGEVLSATITNISNDLVTLDFNHPLAGKRLTFDVSIVELRAATEEELEHGHVHFDDEDYEDEDYEEYDDEEFDDELSYEDVDDSDLDDSLDEEDFSKNSNKH